MSEEKELTDEEIVKSLYRCREGGDGKCEKCVFIVDNLCAYDKGYGADIVLDFIRRIQAKNTELQARVDNLTEELDLADETIVRLKEHLAELEDKIDKGTLIFKENEDENSRKE